MRYCVLSACTSGTHSWGLEVVPEGSSMTKRCIWIMCIIFLAGDLPSFSSSRLGFCFAFSFWWCQYLTSAGRRVTWGSQVACCTAFMRSGNSDRKQCYINLFFFFRDLFEEKCFMCIKQMIERKGKHIKLILTTCSYLGFIICNFKLPMQLRITNAILNKLNS